MSRKFPTNLILKGRVFYRTSTLIFVYKFSKPFVNYNTGLLHFEGLWLVFGVPSPPSTLNLRFRSVLMLGQLVWYEVKSRRYQTNLIVLKLYGESYAEVRLGVISYILLILTKSEREGGFQIVF